MDRQEILRYLGYKGAPADPATEALIDACVAELEIIARRAHTYTVYPIELKDGALCIASRIHIQSRSLARHLTGCRKAAVFAATLGSSTEYALYRYGFTDVSRALVLHACAAAMIEETCDRMEEELSASPASEGLFLRPRFSPGYEDFALQHQKDIVALTRCDTRIGVGVTESFLLTPSKSVTGLIGLSDRSIRQADSCAYCAMKEHCEYRRQGLCCK